MSTQDGAGRREWVYSAKVRGRFQRIHRASGVALQLILFAIPWMSMHGRPLFQADISARRLYLFGAIFTPSDAIYLALIGLFLSFALFFFTALYGRLWCGYACPQTVFLEEWVRRLEALIEGDRGVRRARDRRPWTLDAAGFDKLWRKAAKFSSFGALSLALAMTLASYFTGARPLWSGEAAPVAYGLVGALGLGIFLDFAWFREQLCNFLCPYARLQGALTDDESLTVAYDVARGEPRGKKTSGSCIDCAKCVSVCPQGIDIRDGFQLECVNCARCVDACAEVMGKLDKPSLIAYTTIAETLGRKARALRPRTVVYASLLALFGAAIPATLLSRHDIQASVARAPGSLYTLDADGFVRNTYLVQIHNNDSQGRSGPFTVRVEGLPEGAEIIAPAMPIPADQRATLPLVVRLPSAVSAPTLPLTVTISAPFDQVGLTTTFKGVGSEPG